MNPVGAPAAPTKRLQLPHSQRRVSTHQKGLRSAVHVESEREPRQKRDYTVFNEHPAACLLVPRWPRFAARCRGELSSWVLLSILKLSLVLCIYWLKIARPLSSRCHTVPDVTVWFCSKQFWRCICLQKHQRMLFVAPGLLHMCSSRGPHLPTHLAYDMQEERHAGVCANYPSAVLTGSEAYQTHSMSCSLLAETPAAQAAH